MGLLKKLNKSIEKKPKVMMVEATFENWEQHLETEPSQFLQDLIDQVHKDHPWYKYDKSNFEYTHGGHINFKLKFVRRQIAKEKERTLTEGIDTLIVAIEK